MILDVVQVEVGQQWWDIALAIVTAAGTIGAVLLAFVISRRDAYLREKERVEHAPRHLTVSFGVIDNAPSQVLVYNGGNQPVFEIVVQVGTENNHYDVLSGSPLTPGDSTSLPFSNIVRGAFLLSSVEKSQYRVYFTDHAGVRWWKQVHTDKFARVLKPGENSREPGLRGLLRSAWSTLRGWLRRIDIEGFEGLLILVILILLGYIILT